MANWRKFPVQWLPLSNTRTNVFKFEGQTRDVEQHSKIIGRFTVVPRGWLDVERARADGLLSRSYKAEATWH